MGKKGNITGEVFDTEVIKQIEARQNFLGADFKQDKQLIYQNNKTAFVRLASSINIGSTPNPINNTPFPNLSPTPSFFQTSTTNQTVSTQQETEPLLNRNLPLTLSGDNLAKQCVLFGGVVSINTDNINAISFQQKFGVGENTLSPKGFGNQEIDLSSPSAYGWGGLGSQGYRPMPGIIDANVTFYNRGALAKATVNCKVYSVEQLQIFDLLYFRIGYTMLLEWGHNVYIDNNIDNGSGNYAPNLVNRPTFATKPFQKFFDNKSTQNDIIDSIKSQRFDDSYNYDAMLGKVVNFSWKFNTDGSYDITLNLVGLGDVIEALKINTSVAGNTGAKPSDLLSDEEKKIQELEKQAEAAQLAAENARNAFGEAAAELQDSPENVDELTDAVDTFIEKFGELLLTTALSKTSINKLNNFGEYDTSGTLEDDSIVTQDWTSITLGNLVEGVTNVADGEGISSSQKEALLAKKITYPKIDTNLLLQYVDKKEFTKSDPLINDLFTQIENTNGSFQTSVRSYFKLLLNPNEGITEKDITFDFTSPKIKYIYGAGTLSGALNTGALQYNTSLNSYNQRQAVGALESGGNIGAAIKPTLTENSFSYSTIKNKVKEIYEKIKKEGNKQTEKKNNAAAQLQAANANEQAANNRLKALQKEIALLKDRLQSFPASSAEYRDKSTFNRQLYNWTQYIKNKGNKNTGVINEPTVLNNIQKQALTRYFKELNPTLTDESVQNAATLATGAGGINVGSLALQIDNYVKDLNKNKNPDFCKYSFSYAAQDSEVAGQTLKVDQYYVRLGYMLEWIQNNLLIYSGEKNFQVPTGIGMSVANGVPYLNINTDVNSNILKYFSTQISSDPKICLIPIKFVNEYKGLKSTKTTTDSKTKKTQPPIVTDDLKVNWSAFCDSKSTTQADLSNYFIEGEPDAARLMNIMVNIDYAAAILAQNVDSNGKVTLLDFINSLCLGISDSLGNINKLNAVYDGETNEVKIVDENGINITQNQVNNNPANGISIPKIGKFRVYGVQPGAEGSFVTNVDFQVQLPPNMASMATISAQSSGNIVGENATGLSRLNTGLIDRIIPSKLDAESLKSKETKNTTQDINVIFGDNLQNMNKFVEELYENNKYETKNVEALKSINRDVSLFETGRTAELNKQPAPFFIPFNLSLDMDGLSGMRNYERFSITEDILPYSYRSSDSENGGVIDFIIKGISHNISSNQWKTKIESQTISSIRNPKTRS
jgi:predicted  nucleic acid-binding Zn-ribbon protein